MKLQKILLILTGCLFFLSSCEEGESLGEDPTITRSEIIDNNFLQTEDLSTFIDIAYSNTLDNPWRITSFIRKGNDLTGNFTNNTFFFDSIFEIEKIRTGTISSLFAYEGLPTSTSNPNISPVHRSNATLLKEFNVDNNSNNLVLVTAFSAEDNRSFFPEGSDTFERFAVLDMEDSGEITQGYKILDDISDKKITLIKFEGVNEVKLVFERN